MKVVINRCEGGFCLSDAAKEMLGIKYDEAYWFSDKRADPKLVKVVEKLGSAANGPYAKLKIVEIPDNIKWYIVNHSGWEHIEEKPRIWC